MDKKCVLDTNKICDNCGKCDLCDLDNTKICDNCMKCVLGDKKDFISIKIDKVISEDND